MATTARTREDVEKMNARDRLWDSLNNAYGTKTQRSNEAFEKAYSAADRQLIGRGMQRSSYGAQTLANINKQKIDAANDISSELIADYENRLAALDQQEAENERWEKQFAEGQRQFNERQNLTRSENALNRAFQTSEREASQTYQAGENALNRAFQTGEREASQAYQSGENALARAFQTGEREATQAFQSGENAANRAFKAQENQANRDLTQGQFDVNMAFNREQAAQQQANTNRAFEYQTGRDAVADQQWQKAFDQEATNFNRQLAASYAQALLSAGQEVPQSLLSQAGLRISGGQVVVDNTPSGGGYGGGYGGNRSNSTKAPASTTSSSLPEDFNSFASSISAFANGVNTIGSSIKPSLLGMIDAQMDIDSGKTLPSSAETGNKFDPSILNLKNPARELTRKRTP